MPNLAILEQQPVTNIVGRSPSWLVTSGIGLLFSIVVVLLILTWFIRYPDVIYSRVVLTTTEVPSILVSKSDGRIIKLFVSDGQSVNIGQPLLLLESDVEYSQLIIIEKALKQLKRQIDDLRPKSIDSSKFEESELGILQKPSNQLASAIQEYNQFSQSIQLTMQLESNELLKERYIALKQHLLKKQQTWTKKIQIENSRLTKNKNLNKLRLLADVDLEPLESRNLSQQLSFDDLNVQMELYNIKLLELKRMSFELSIQQQEKKQRLFAAIKTQYSYFISELHQWKQKYLFQAPIAGRVSFSHFWSVNQHIKYGEETLTIVNENSIKLGKLLVKQTGAGKIKIGQRVDIELDSFPAVEFGKVIGKVSAISLVPNQEGYVIDIQLEGKNGITTTHNKKLKFIPNMIGSAKIITNEKRLVQRFFDKLFYLTKSHS